MKKEMEIMIMKKTKKMNVVLAMVLSMTLLFGATISANAASASVLLTVEQTNVNTAVTVPGQIPIVFNEDGTNTYPTNWIIYNKSEIAGVHLVKVDLESKGSWELLKESDDVKTMAHDTRAIKFYMGTPGKLRLMSPYADGTASLAFEDDYAVSLASGANQQFEFEVERGAFNTAMSEHIAFGMTLTFAYN